MGNPEGRRYHDRAIRPQVITRKSSKGTHSPQGSTMRMRLYSLAATLMAQGHNPLEQFRALITTPLPQV